MLLGRDLWRSPSSVSPPSQSRTITNTRSAQTSLARVPPGHLWSTSQSCKCRRCYLLVRGGIYCDRWGRCLGTYAMFPSQFRAFLDILDPKDFALMRLGGCWKAWMGDSEEIPFSTGISTEDDFLDRFQARKACENQRYTINSRVFFCTAVILQVVVVVWFFEKCDLLCSTILGGLKRHYLYLQALSFLPSVHYCGCSKMPHRAVAPPRGKTDQRSPRRPPWQLRDMDQSSIDLKWMHWLD